MDLTKKRLVTANMQSVSMNDAAVLESIQATENTAEVRNQALTKVEGQDA